jgi:natural product biosynthesis luciferase-like monooxygenase protein
VNSPWFSAPTVDYSAASIRLFCLPYAGGNASVFRRWQAELGSACHVVPVRLPGRLERMSEAPYTRLDVLADALATQMSPLLDRAYALFGISMGALVAFETARRLAASGRPPARLFLASYPSPSVPSERPPGREMSDAAFIELLRGIGAMPPELLNDSEMMRLLLPTIRADFEVTESHRDDIDARIEAPITAIYGTGDAVVRKNDMERWADKSAADVELVETGGGHFFIHGENETLFALLRDRLTEGNARMSDLSRRLEVLTAEQRSLLRERLRGQSRPQRPSRTGPRWSLFFFAASHGRDARDQYQLMLECARFADRSGFEALWVPERHFDPFGAPYPSPAVLAAALATATSRLHIRAGSLVLPLHDPIRVAEDWAVVDNLSQGRTGVALASGWHVNDFVFQPDAYDKRKEILVEHLATIRALFAGDHISRMDGAAKEISLRTYPSPVDRDMPLWITSSSSEQTWRTGAEHGLHVLTGLVEQSVDVVADRVRVYHEALREAGRDPARHTVTAMVHTFIGSDTEDIREIVREPLTQYLQAHIELYEKLARSKDLAIDPDQVTQADKDTLAAFAFERYFTSHGLFGTPEQALPMVRRLREAGVDEIACLIDFGLPADTVLGHLEHLVKLRDLAEETAA